MATKVYNKIKIKIRNIDINMSIIFSYFSSPCNAILWYTLNNFLLLNCFYDLQKFVKIDNVLSYKLKRSVLSGFMLELVIALRPFCIT